MQENVSWKKTNTLGAQKNVWEPLLLALKESLIAQKTDLQNKLNNLKRLGVVSVNKEELDKTLDGMKF